MRILIDSADLTEIKQILEYNIISGITTNPSLVSRTFKDKNDSSFIDFLKGITEIFPNGEISGQVTEVLYERILEQGKRILDISPNIVLKLPLTRSGIRACEYFAKKGRKTNITLCFTASQALICALAGATYVSVFLGRTEDNFDGNAEEKVFSSKKLIEDTKKIFDNYKFKTKILGASIRNIGHINTCAVACIDAITISPKLFYQMIDNDLSIAGAEEFVRTWNDANLIL